MENKTPDWRIGELYQSAIAIVKRNKVLWIFALALGASSSSFSSGHSANFSQSDLQSLQKVFEQNQHTSHAILGAQTNILWDTISYLFSAVSPFWYVLIGIELLVLFCVGILISLVYHGWAEAGLLEGITNAMNATPVGLKDLSEKAFFNIKRILWVRFIPTLIVLSIYFLVIVLTYFLGSFLDISILFILLLIELAIFIAIMIRVSLAIIWAVRIVVIEKKPAKEAFFTGLTIAKKKFWPMMGLGLLNIIVVSFATGILLIPLFFFFIGSVVAVSFLAIFTNALLLGIVIFFATLVIICLVTFIQLGGGILSAFSATVWSLAYNKIRGKYDK